MRNVTMFFVFIGVHFCVLLSSQSDTIRNGIIDTILCSTSNTEFFFMTPYDTAQYSQTWYYDGVDTSLASSINIAEVDSVILINTPDGIFDDVIIDSFHFILRTFPEPNLFIPEPECYNEDSIVIKDNTVYDSSYVIASYMIDSEVKDISQDSTISYLLRNGDSAFLIANYEVVGCDTLIEEGPLEISNIFLPTAEFDYTKTCENENLILNNLSNSSDTVSSLIYSFEIEGGQKYDNLTPSFTFPDTLPHENYSIDCIVENDGCRDTFNLDVAIDSVTYVSFKGLESSYCAMQDFSLLIAMSSSGNISGGTYSGEFIDSIGIGQAIFQPISDTSQVKVYYMYTNDSTCTDIDSQTVDVIYPKPNLILNGLESEYCELDDPALLNIHQMIEDDSSFYEIFKDGEIDIWDAENSTQYEFNPMFPGEYEIVNMYSDINGCRDTISETTTVHPLPIVSLDPIRIIEPGEEIEIELLNGAEQGISYTWSNQSENESIIVSQPGVYVLYGMNDDTGCEARDTTIIEYDPDIEIELIDLQISPNPTSGVVEIQLSQEVQNIRLVNVFGNEISIGGISNFNTDINGMLSLDLSNRVEGYYYILIPGIGNFLLLRM